MQPALLLLSTGHPKSASERGSKLLEVNPRDSAAWLLKTRSEIEYSNSISLHLDVIDIEFEADLCESNIPRGSNARPGTSLRTASAHWSQGENTGYALRPTTARVSTGYIRPMTAARSGTNSTMIPNSSNRISTSSGHIMSSSGRMVRLGTASFVSGAEPGVFINVDRLDLKCFATKPVLSRTLFEYIFTCLGNIPKALELASNANTATGNTDWWWKLQASKCSIKLQLYREAEKQLKESLELQDMLLTRMYLAKVYLQLDQPNLALKVYDAASKQYPDSSMSHISKARVYDLLHDTEKASRLYKAQGMADIVLGLCAFYSQQFNSALPCFEHALELSTNDATTADVWFNISHVAINVGDFELAQNSLKLAVSFNPSHGEAWNNLAIIEYQMLGDEATTESHLKTSQRVDESIHASSYNLAVLALARGDMEASFENAQKSLQRSNDDTLTTELVNKLNEMLV
ncbi:UNVERIFIED_CONTAM: Tetratricopeptide repeat protein 8 [Siphonaria sp. JEL0065]|nr:Tetratricopeptide repeat protein 8 [Siphonaria sp. JEL0065]